MFFSSIKETINQIKNQTIKINDVKISGKVANKVSYNAKYITSGIAPIPISLNILTNKLKLCLTASASLFQFNFGYFKFITNPKTLNVSTEIIGNMKLINKNNASNGMKQAKIILPINTNGNVIAQLNKIFAVAICLKESGSCFKMANFLPSIEIVVQVETLVPTITEVNPKYIILNIEVVIEIVKSSLEAIFNCSTLSNNNTPNIMANTMVIIGPTKPFKVHIELPKNPFASLLNKVFNCDFGS